MVLSLFMEYKWVVYKVKVYFIFNLEPSLCLASLLSQYFEVKCWLKLFLSINEFHFGNDFLFFFILFLSQSVYLEQTKAFINNCLR